jgi:UPF0755 protein
MKQHFNPWFSCLLLLLLLICIGAAFVSALVVFLPLQAERRFGAPSPGLSPIQHLYLSANLLLQTEDLVRPLDAHGTEREFYVELGEPTQTIIQRLESEGFIRNGQALRNLMVYAGLDKSIQAGEYRLSPAFPALQIARLLQDATPTVITFRILPGWRLEEIAEALPTSGLEFSPKAFLDAAQIPPEGYTILEYHPPLASLEGFLFPDTYRFARKTTASEFIATLLANFEKHLDPSMLQGFERQGLNLYEAVTLASIVEREAIIDEEMPVIASVLLNRLSAGMNLAADPTVQYALGYNHQQQTWWTNPLSLQDLQIKSPYNTYIHPALPPGPIANPGVSALKAVAFPAQTSYYFFRATCDGSGRHWFAETYEQHLQNACP